MRKLMILAVMAGLIATPAMAAFVTAPTYDQAAINLPASAQRTAIGDTFDSLVGVFNAGGGSAISAGPFAFTMPEASTSMGANILYARPADVLFTATETAGPGPNQFTYDFEWVQANGDALIPAGALLGGAPVTTVSFEMGSSNSGGDGVGGGLPFIFDHPEDLPDNPGTFLASFDLLGAGGSVLFSGNWFVSDIGGNEFNGVTFVGAGGADLAQFGITGARAQVTITEVPEPASLALLGLGGIAILRRRR